MVSTRQRAEVDPGSPLALGRHRSGRGNPGTIEQRSETRGCIGSHLWRYIPVELQRGLHAIVSQPLAHRLDVDALLEQQRRVRVTEAMQPDRRKPGPIADAPTEASTYDVRILGCATGPAENQVQVGSVGLAPGAALKQLALSLFAQEVDRLPVEVDCADALRALWRTETEGFPLSRVLLPDRQPDPIEIDIAPAEAEQLAAPHARGGGDVVKSKLPGLPRECQAGCQLVSGPCRHFRPVLRLGVGPLGGIATQQAIVDSVLQRFAKADVDVVHCLLDEPALCELPIETADAETVDRLERHVTESRADVVMDAHPVVARRARA